MQAPYLIGARRQQISISILCHRFLHGNLGKISRFIHKYRGIFIIKYNKAIGKLLAPIFAYHIRLVKIRILNLPRLKSRGSQPRILTDSDTLGYPRSSYGSYICYAATKNIDKSVYVLEKFLVHRARSRRPKGASY